MFEDTKVIIRNRLSKKDTQYKSQKYQRYNKGPQNTTQKN